MKKFFLLLVLSFCILNLNAQKSNKRELRGAWVSTVGGLDWPVRGATASSQKTALVNILEQHRQTGFNTIYFQCRSQSDALYQSNIEPWSWDLTGIQGKDPGYDPMQFAIDETRKRGMEIHAWVNPFRAVTSTGALSDTNRFKSFCIAKTHPEWLLTFGTVQILNPGIPAVREYVKSIVSDIVRRYDIDGIHFDDYFYLSPTVADDATYLADPRGFPNTTAGKADWRRDNINMFIRDVYDSIKSIKPWVKFGVSPSGIYRSSTNPAIGSNTSSGANQHYLNSFADTKKWLQQGWVDYIAPQVYWFINQVGSDYKILIPWWNDNAFGRHIYIGMASYKVGNSAESSDANWLTDRSQIPKQVRMNRDALYPNVLGGIFFRTVHLSQNRLNHRDSLRLRFYTKPALQPTMPWRDNVAPDAPTSLTATRYNNDSVVLTWTKPAAAADEMNKAKRFVIYRSTNPVIDITDANNIVAITANDTTAFRNTGLTAGTTYYYTVTSLDHFHNESATSNFVADEPPTITCPGNQDIYTDSACTAYIPDLTSLVTTENAVSVTQSPEALTAVNGAVNTIVTLTATNAVGQTATCTVTVVSNDTIPPVPAAINPLLANGGIVAFNTDPGVCSFTAGTQLDLTASDNCSSSFSYSFTITHNATTFSFINVNSLSGLVFQKGTSVVNWTVSDESGNSATFSYTVVVSDNEAPVISNVTASETTLFPPNHKMRNVTIQYTATDNCGAVTTALSVSSNEPEYGTGSGDTGPDWQVLNNHVVKLRAERAGSGSDRVYTITITATDAGGNKSTSVVTVTVPHDNAPVTMSKPVITNEPEENLAVSVSPNPTTNRFYVVVPKGEGKASIRITNAEGRVIEKRMGIAGGSRIALGGNYLPGTYFVEIIRGEVKKTVKLVKQ
jgi:uncharacterized lipoprotein YddW (UPF0748 family)